MRIALLTLALALSTCVYAEQCSELSASFHSCAYNESCTYNTNNSVVCTTPSHISCDGPRTFTKYYNCRYCHQTEYLTQHSCALKEGCDSFSNKRYLSVCTMAEDEYCMGERKFMRYMKCNWVSSKKWAAAAWISLIFGGIGVDRLYLGYYVIGIVKIFTLSALGLWTLVDFVLILIGYVNPNDGSRYFS